MAIAAPAYAQDAAMPDKAATASAADPFAADSPLPLHYPQFDKISDSDFAPAFDRGMAEELAEVKAIAENPEAPTFENTIIALGKSGPVRSEGRRVGNEWVRTCRFRGGPYH